MTAPTAITAYRARCSRTLAADLDHGLAASPRPGHGRGSAQRGARPGAPGAWASMPRKAEVASQRCAAGTELRVLSLLPTLLSLQEIGGRLYLARPTVKTHVASIYDKLGVSGRTEVVEKLEQSGLEPTHVPVAGAVLDRRRLRARKLLADR